MRLDQVIFSQVSKGAGQQTQEGMLESQTVRFILLAGRSLLLDMLMLEAMLVVDEAPTSSVFHIDVEMVSAPASGSIAVLRGPHGRQPSSLRIGSDFRSLCSRNEFHFALRLRPDTRT